MIAVIFRQINQKIESEKRRTAIEFTERILFGKIWRELNISH